MNFLNVNCLILAIMIFVNLSSKILFRLINKPHRIVILHQLRFFPIKLIDIGLEFCLSRALIWCFLRHMVTFFRTHIRQNISKHLLALKNIYIFQKKFCRFGFSINGTTESFFTQSPLHVTSLISTITFLKIFVYAILWN